MNPQLMQQIALVMGTILALPFLIALVRASMFVGSMDRTVKDTAKLLDSFIKRVDSDLSSHDDRTSSLEKQVAVLWDGRDRRTGEDRRIDVRS